METALAPSLVRLRGPENLPPTPEQILDLKVCDPAMGSGAFLVEVCRQLGDALVEAWKTHSGRPIIPPDEDEVIFARRLVAQRCLYGVDKNPMAVDLAKVSLWLATLAKDHALTFVDHALRHGDSLVGLSRKQIEALQWEPTGAIMKGLEVREPLDRVFALRRQIREADDSVSDWELRDLWDQAQFELGKVRLFGDLVLAAFFEEDKPKDRERKRSEYATAIVRGEAERYRGWLEEWRQAAERPFVPFHWEIEFPEVFERKRAGFDAFVGNPPFMGGSKISSTLGAAYLDWVLDLHEESHGNGDVVAHFFRRAFHLVREGGTFGLIATNTISQGDTRATGLRWVCGHGGEIYCARKRVKWPGLAAVVVSVLHVLKGPFAGPKRLDDREVETITAFLFHRGSHHDPAHLTSNRGLSFAGSKIYGPGFIFDADKKDVTTSLVEMRQLVEKDPRNQELILPYIGGEEVNASATHAHSRYVINFAEMSEAEARCWPDLMDIVERKVKPERVRLANNADGRRRRQYWWQFERLRPDLYAAVAALKRVLVTSQTSKYRSMTFLPVGMVYDQKLVVFRFDTVDAFCLLHSRVHEYWALFFGSTMKDDPVYTPSDCFETFPFPENWEAHPTLEAAGQAYYEFRAALMVRNDEGLTKTYNRFHDPEERDPEIEKLRELHAAMDRAVLNAYGWADIPTDCEFLLDYEIDEEEWGKKKKPYRYRWPDEVHDEVLARLLELNARRAQEEARAGATAGKRIARKPGGKRAAKSSANGDLFS